MSDAQRLLEEFQSYLEHSDLNQIPDDTPDLNTLFSEMAGLKGEVKAQSRHFKGTLDTLSEALTAIQLDNKVFIEERALHQANLEKQRIETLRAVLLDMVDIYDRLTIGLDVLNNYQPVSSLFSHSKKQDIDFIGSFNEGQTMILKRFELMLQRHQVYPIDCVGKMFDPGTMSAVEIGHDASLDNGRVIEELRKGFLIQDRVLRLAEVKVNKL